MRWDDLFDDLDGQASAAFGEELRAETDERSRAERGRVTLVERLSVADGRLVDVALVGGERVRGRVAGVGDGWCRLEVGRDELLVPLSSLARVRLDPGARADARTTAAQQRLGLRPVLRALARRRVYVRLASRGVPPSGGTLDAVAADHLELAEHPADRPRRGTDVQAVSLVPYDVLQWLRYEGS